MSYNLIVFPNFNKVHHPIYVCIFYSSVDARIFVHRWEGHITLLVRTSSKILEMEKVGANFWLASIVTKYT